MCCFSLLSDQLATLNLFLDSKDSIVKPNQQQAVILSFAYLSYFMHFSILIRKCLFCLCYVRVWVKFRGRAKVRVYVWAILALEAK